MRQYAWAAAYSRTGPPGDVPLEFPAFACRESRIRIHEGFRIPVEVDLAIVSTEWDLSRRNPQHSAYRGGDCHREGAPDGDPQ